MISTPAISAVAATAAMAALVLAPITVNATRSAAGPPSTAGHRSAAGPRSAADPRFAAGPRSAAQPLSTLSSYPDLPAPLPGTRPSARPGGGEIASVGSLNWSGYAVNKRRASFRSVKATFFVPYLNCIKSPGRTMSSAWAGLDGFVGASHSVEQAGIAANCSATGKASYAAWFEMFPLPQAIVPISIRGGDSITVQVAYKPSDRVFSLKLVDNTRGDRFARYRKCPLGKRLRCARGSAEVIAEAPATVAHGHVVIDHLADYGAISFAAIQIVNGTGRRGGLLSSRWDTTKIIQERSPSGPLVARPTPIQLNMFDSYWLREN
jgi:Peptidase A4 family